MYSDINRSKWCLLWTAIRILIIVTFSFFFLDQHLNNILQMESFRGCIFDILCRAKKYDSIQTFMHSYIATRTSSVKTFSSCHFTQQHIIYFWIMFLMSFHVAIFVICDKLSTSPSMEFAWFHVSTVSCKSIVKIIMIQIQVS